MPRTVASADGCGAIYRVVYQRRHGVPEACGPCSIKRAWQACLRVPDQPWRLTTWPGRARSCSRSEMTRVIRRPGAAGLDEPAGRRTGVRNTMAHLSNLGTSLQLRLLGTVVLGVLAA